MVWEISLHRLAMEPEDRDQDHRVDERQPDPDQSDHLDVRRLALKGVRQ